MTTSYRFGRRVPPCERRPVAWYAPTILLHAAQELVYSEDFLRNYDRRETFARDGKAEVEVMDFSDRAASHEQPFVFDFIADTGDGGRATFAVAQGALASTLAVATPNGGSEALPEGELLILGGDLAYPGANSVEYQYRFLEMFEMARDDSTRFAPVRDETHDTSHGPHKFVAAIPQNHDWFDSAATFCRYFVNHDKGVFIGARTPQSQSYFATKLSHDWWVLGFDWALSGDLDRYQFEAFAELAERELTARSDLILIYPEPYWTRPIGDGAPQGYPKRYQRLEAMLEERGARIRMRLAGDSHHYRRETLDVDPLTGLDTHLITCGTGGAFTHPTHGVDVQGIKVLDRSVEPDVIGEEFERRVRAGRIDGEQDQSLPAHRCFAGQCTYPDASDTLSWARWGLPFSLFRIRFSRSPRQLDWRTALGEMWHSNFGFALALGVLYGINAYVNSFVFSASFAEDGFAPMGTLEFSRAAPLWLNAMVFSPFATGVNLLMLAGCVRIAWEGPGPRQWRLLSGIVHGFVHGFAIFTLYWIATHLLLPWLAGMASSSLAVGLASWLLVGIGGVLMGGLLFGSYLALACGVFGQLPNNAFGALAIEDWKGFLRLRLHPDGLEVNMLGLDRVPQQPDAQSRPRGWRLVDRFTLRKTPVARGPVQR